MVCFFDVFLSIMYAQKGMLAWALVFAYLGGFFAGMGLIVTMITLKES